MDAIALFRNRVAAVNTSLHGLVGKVDGLDLTRPVVPGTSPLALTLWHLPRTQDWLVHTCIRTVPETVERFGRDGLPDPERYGFGTGLAPDDAEAAARDVEVTTLLEYADAVAADIDGWLASITEGELDVVPPLLDRQQARAAYTTPGALDEVTGLDGLPTGVLLVRPALSHQFWHLGEMDVLAQVARAGAAAG